jgi:hypothetical protein
LSFLTEAVVLFGAGGFVGRNLVDAFAKRVPLVIDSSRFLGATGWQPPFGLTDDIKAVLASDYGIIR